ncbi:MAG: MarR family winged helix-turn-helix transcriptional regulator [Gemmatimonadota bacterium]|nr:MarR family winged helix-turn-helix transcriptional regulator [Gemmatimonadota bacterium]
MDYDHLRALGPLGLANRFRRIAERLTAQARSAHREADVDFEPRWFPLFSLLLDAGGTTVGEAARALEISHVAVSRTASQMSGAGLIERRDDPDDGRATRLVLTPLGSRVALELDEVWDDLNRRWGGLIEATGHDLLAVLDAVESAAT